METKGELSERFQERFDIVEKTCERLLQHVNSLADLLKQESGKCEMTSFPFNIRVVDMSVC